jgi:uncharacterized glyoxalase superfamily protein PhnB
MTENSGGKSEMRNRSVPTDAVLPHITYQDVDAAVAWLATTFGFVEHYRYGPIGASQGAQMYVGNGCVMLESARGDRYTPRQAGYGTQYLTVFVDNVEAHFAQTQAAGARIVEALNETVYGERQYVAEDLDGHKWLFSQHGRDVDPGDWGARVAGR